MKKIINPWKGQNLNNCFGCGDSNKIGFRLEFFDNGEEIVAFYTPDRNYEGYRDTLHGGIQSTLHDEIAGWTTYLKAETSGMTVELNVKYLKSVKISDGEIKITGKLINRDRKFATIETHIYNKAGEVCSEGMVIYRIFPQTVAVEKMHYPGIEAFYEKE